MPKIKHKPEVMHLIVVAAIAIFIALASVLIYNTTSSINEGVNQYSDRLAAQKSNFVKNTISYEVKSLVNFSACLTNYKTIPSNIIVKD
ncbi:MAG: GGDEF domain-containing protein, partial [Ruminiclostridium sp.]